MGRNLTPQELYYVKLALTGIERCGFWEQMEGGNEYWNQVFHRLVRMIEQGTIDGKINPRKGQWEWITPTDEDAKRRPQVECSDTNLWLNPQVGILIRVRSVAPFRFIVDHNETGIGNWVYCRMKKLQ